jgi:hypothetical protein
LQGHISQSFENMQAVFSSAGKEFKMKSNIIIILLAFSCISFSLNFESDIMSTSAGDLEMTFIGHGTLMFKFNNIVIHIDPVSREADYAKLPKADLILITHEHGEKITISGITVEAVARLQY